MKITNAKRSARIMGVQVSGELFHEWLTQEWATEAGTVLRCTQGLPPSARYAWAEVVYREPYEPDIMLVYEDETFDVVALGETIPLLICKYTVEAV